MPTGRATSGGAAETLVRYRAKVLRFAACATARIKHIRDKVIGGRPLEDAITTALRTTGAAVFSTFAVMIGGILPWAFSPLLFHNEMSLLLIFLMATNMIAGVLIPPCFIAWRRPRFIHRQAGSRAGDAGRVAHRDPGRRPALHRVGRSFGPARKDPQVRERDRRARGGTSP